MTTTIETPLDSLSCDYCLSPVADDFGGYVRFTAPAVITDNGVYCETCAVDANGWPFEGNWCETGEEVSL